MDKFDFIANIIDGQLSDRFKDNINRFLKTMPDGPANFIIKKYKKKRSDPQNRYYWSVVVEILGNEIGYSKDEMHDALKWKFLKRPGVDGLPDTCGSTKKLSTEAFEAYIEEIKRWAATDMSIYIPDPNEEEGRA